MNFTREEVLEMLKHLSRIDGYLLGQKDASGIHDEIDYRIEILTKKLLEE